MKKTKKIPVTVYFPKAILAEIDKEVERLTMSRSETIVLMLMRDSFIGYPRDGKENE